MNDQEICQGDYETRIKLKATLVRLKLCPIGKIWQGTIELPDNNVLFLHTWSLDGKSRGSSDHDLIKKF